MLKLLDEMFHRGISGSEAPEYGFTRIAPGASGLMEL